tara:strand:- start:1572 stop:2030 length:459 start_codon:yes stop_codon:yes gene_type:complete
MLKLKILIYLALILSPLREKGIIRDVSAFVEVNHVYRYDETDGIYVKRLVQVIWWEWKNHIVIEDAGDYRSESGFVVKDYRVTWSYSSRPQQTKTIVPRLEKGKWVCLFYDKGSQKIREVKSNWKKESHTSFDVEVVNRNVLHLNERSRLKK